MLHVNERYVDETRDEKGNVVDYQYKYPENFNFAYDVVDAIAEAEPGRRAMIWCNPCGEEHVFTFYCLLLSFCLQFGICLFNLLWM